MFQLFFAILFPRWWGVEKTRLFNDAFTFGRKILHTFVLMGSTCCRFGRLLPWQIKLPALNKIKHFLLGKNIRQNINYYFAVDYLQLRARKMCRRDGFRVSRLIIQTLSSGILMMKSDEKAFKFYSLKTLFNLLRKPRWKIYKFLSLRGKNSFLHFFLLQFFSKNFSICVEKRLIGNVSLAKT